MQNNAYVGSHGECALNPFVGKEGTPLSKNGNGKKIVIVGAGIGGLTAGAILKKRGFEVTILEKEEVAGGQINLAKAPPKKDKTGWAIEDSVSIAKELGVEITFGVSATPEIINELNPYAVILATGSTPSKPRFKGEYDYEKLYTFEDILSGKIVLENKKIAVIGSGMTGLETAHYLTELGNKVTIVEMANEIAPGTWMQHVDDVMPHLKKAGTSFMIGHKLKEIKDGAIITENVESGAEARIKVDSVVLALGSKPNTTLKESIEALGYNTYVIGDANKIGKIADATKSAYLVATSIE
jgi:pyruvate/2-oxoglutarate dehydrogenase complex dihydrolipoamide dehydrogenase (E3) component